MLFDDVMASQVQQLRAFLGDESRNGLLFRVDADLELVAARFLAQFSSQQGNEPPDDTDEPDTEGDEDAPPRTAAHEASSEGDEGLGDEISFGASADFLEAEAFYIEVTKQIAEVVNSIRAAYAEQEEEIHVPEGLVLDRAWPKRAPIEAIFAEYLEGVARGLAGVHSHCLFVLRIDAMPKPEETARSLARLGGYLAHPGAKLIVLDDRTLPRLPELRSVSTRYRLDVYPPREEDVSLWLERFFSNAAARVLGLRIKQADVGQLMEQLKSLPWKHVPVVTRSVDFPFDDRAHYADLAYRQIATGSAPPPEWMSRSLASSSLFGQWSEPKDLPPNLYDMRALDRPESTLTELLERATPRCELRCFVLRARVRKREEWDTFVNELTRAAAAADTRYIILDVDEQAPLPAADTSERVWATQEFVLNAEQMQGGLEASVAQPDLPIDTRAQHLSLLSGLRAAQGRHDDAIRLASESIELAETHAKRPEAVAAWWALGRALSRAGRTAEARNAFGESVTGALDLGSTLNAANALMGIGHTHFKEHNWTEAINTYKVAIEHWKNAGQVFGECQAQVWLAEAHRKARALEEAEAELTRVVARFEAMRPPYADIARAGLAEVFERLSALLRDAGKQTQADEYAARAKQCGSVGTVPDEPS
jgi:tetratricopeptide (TPR) repeat protein